MADRDLEQAEELLRKARYPEAIERFRALLSADPESPELRARCGEAYRLSGNRDRAFHHYDKGAAIYARNGDAGNALRLLQYANAVLPNEPNILFRMAECLRALGDQANLEPLLRQIVSVARGSGDRRRVWALDVLAELHPEDLEIAVRRAEALTEAGRVNEAVNAWKLVSARLDQRGIDFVPMIQRAAAIAPDRPDVGADLAGILLANRRPRDALVLLVPFYEKFPDDIPILELLLRALEALGAADKIIPARIELIKARAKRGLREPAIREIGILLQSAPEDANALEVSAHAFTAFGDDAEALALWKRLMHLYDRTGRRFERDRAVLMVLKADPDDEEALVIGSRALREAGRNEEAVVLENRLAVLKKLKARGALPQKPQQRSASVDLVPPSKSSPSAIGGRSASTPALAVHRPSFDEPSMAPDEMPGESAFAMFDEEGDLSEPSLESMPIAKNPYTEGLDLGVAAVRAPSVMASKPVMPTETGEYTVELTTPESPIYESPLHASPVHASPVGKAGRAKGAAPVLRAPSVTHEAPPPKAPANRAVPSKSQPVGAALPRAATPPTRLPTPTLGDARGLGAGATRAPSPQPTRVIVPDTPTRPYDDPSDPLVVTALEADDTGVMEQQTSDHDAGTILGTLGEDGAPSGGFDLDLELAIESPTSPEETTSRMAQLVLDEIEELRAQYGDRTERGAASSDPQASSQGPRASGRSPAPTDFEAEVRPTLRSKLVEDLFGRADVSRPKKA